MNFHTDGYSLTYWYFRTCGSTGIFNLLIFINYYLLNLYCVALISL